MKSAVHCPECGSLTRTELIKGRLEGLCPSCLSAIALEEAGELKVTTCAPLPIAAPGLPPELTNAGSLERLGKFILAQKLGAGSAGEVWKAWDSELGRWVALKIFHPGDFEEISRYRREAQTAAKLSDPGIAAIYEAGSDRGRHYLAMQYLEGTTLQRFPRKDKRLLVKLIRDAARAVGAAHRQGIIHRDLKPANLLVTQQADAQAPHHLFVLDFGLARQVEGASKLTVSGLVVGTPAYMPPEQARGDPVDGRADVYGLGATLFHVLTGNPPFKGANVYEVLRKVEEDDPPRLRRFDSTINPDLETVVLKCLEKDPGRRYASADELAEDLDRYLIREPVLARPIGPITRVARRVSKRRSAVLSGVAIACLVGGTVFVVPRWRAEAKARADLVGRRERLERSRPQVEVGKGLINRAGEALEAGERKSRLREAREAFEKALHEAPENAEAFVGLGRALYFLEGQAPALAAFDRAILADPLYAPAYLQRVRIQLDEYTKLRQDLSGKAVPETPAARELRLRLEADLRKVELYARDYPHQAYTRGLLAFANGEYAAALPDIEAFLKHDPGDFPANFCQGRSLWHLGRFAEAEESFSRALKADPLDARTLGMRGLARKSLRRFDEALEDFNKAIELNPANLAVYLNRGGLLTDHKNLHDDAIADFDKAISLNPKCAPGFGNRGIARYRKGDLKEAIEDFDQAINLGSPTPAVYRYRGEARGRLGHHAQAIDDFVRALDLGPKDALIYNSLGLARAAVGDPRAAIDAYDEAIQLDDRFANAFTNRGNAKYALQRYDEAIDDHTQALKIEPNHARAMDNRGIARKGKKDLDGAIADHTAAIKMDEKLGNAWANRGFARAMKGLHEEAVDDLTRALDLNVRIPAVYNNLGLSLGQLGRKEEAIVAFTSAIDKYPNYANAYANRGHVKRDLGQNEAAVADYQKALDVAPANWTYRAAIEKRLKEMEATDSNK